MLGKVPRRRSRLGRVGPSAAREVDPTLDPGRLGRNASAYKQEHYSKTAHRAQLCFRYTSFASSPLCFQFGA